MMCVQFLGGQMVAVPPDFFQTRVNTTLCIGRCAHTNCQTAVYDIFLLHSLPGALTAFLTVGQIYITVS